MHTQVRPSHLQQFFQPCHDRGRMRGGGGHKVVGRGQPPHRAVVKNHAVVAQHNAVSRFAARQFGEAVGVDAVEKRGRVGALHRDFAERSDIADANGGAHRRGLADVSVFEGLVAARVIPRPLPQAGHGHDRAALEVPLVQRGAAQRPEVRADAAPAQRAERDRGIRRAEGGDAGGGDVDGVVAGVVAVGRVAGVANAIDASVGVCAAVAVTVTVTVTVTVVAAARFRQQRQADDIAGLAAVARHAERGVAFQVFDRVETFAVREADIVGGDIVQRVDQRFGFHAGRAHFIQRADGIAPAAGGRGGDFCGGFAQGPGRGRAGRLARHTACVGAPNRGRGAGDGVGIGERKTRQFFIPPRPASQVRDQVNRRRPAAGHQQRVAFNSPAAQPTAAAAARRLHGLYAATAMHFQRRAARVHRDAVAGWLI